MAGGIDNVLNCVVYDLVAFQSFQQCGLVMGLFLLFPRDVPLLRGLADAGDLQTAINEKLIVLLAPHSLNSASIRPFCDCFRGFLKAALKPFNEAANGDFSGDDAVRAKSLAYKMQVFRDEAAAQRALAYLPNDMTIHAKPRLDLAGSGAAEPCD